MDGTCLAAGMVHFGQSNFTADESHSISSKLILYFIFSLGSLLNGDVYRHESGSCLTLHFFLTFLILHIIYYCQALIMVHMPPKSFC